MGMRPEDRKSQVVWAMLRPQERQLVEAQAAREGRSISSLIRRAVLKELTAVRASQEVTQ